MRKNLILLLSSLSKCIYMSQHTLKAVSWYRYVYMCVYILYWEVATSLEYCMVGHLTQNSRGLALHPCFTLFCMETLVRHQNQFAPLRLHVSTYMFCKRVRISTMQFGYFRYYNNEKH